MLKNKKLPGLLCFSPPVMFATFVVELVLALWLILKYSLKNTVRRLAFIILICLAVFQFAEFNVCGKYSIDALAWSKIGFVAITLLPAFGMHLVYEIAKYKNKLMFVIPYFIAFIWIYIFIFSEIAFKSHQCAGNYAIFQLHDIVGRAYFFYYYGLLFSALLFAGQKLKTITKPRRRALQALISGYLLFMIPTFIINNLNPETERGIPSIMCGFAVLFAFILCFIILPQEQQFRHVDKH